MSSELNGAWGGWDAPDRWVTDNGLALDQYHNFMITHMTDWDVGFPVYKIYHNDELLWTSGPNMMAQEYENLWVSVGDSYYPAANGLFNGWSLRMFSDQSACAIHSCGIHATCTENAANDGYTCGCLAGYTDNGSGCMDVNECDSNPCSADETCHNYSGGYFCHRYVILKYVV